MSETWGIVSLMGHSQIAGRLSEANLGCPMLRVDVPAVNGNAAFSVLYGGNAIFCVSIVDKELATETAKQFDLAPVTAVYGMKEAIARLCRDRLKGEQDDDNRPF